MPTARYTRAQLVVEAHAAGFEDVDERLISYYVSLGLVDEGRPGRGRGRGGGVPRYWSGYQRDLLLQILRNKAGGGRRIATLCNLPVARWTYLGDYCVPTRQTKRALGTWLDHTSHAFWGQSTRSAGELIETFLPDVRGEKRTEILHSIANITYSGAFNADQLRAELRNAGGPANEIVRGGETYYLTDLAIGRIAAIIHTRSHLDEISDDQFKYARTELQASSAEYLASQPRLATAPDIGHLYTPTSLEQLASNACANLAQLLGHSLIAADKLPPVSVGVPVRTEPPLSAVSLARAANRVVR